MCCGGGNTPTSGFHERVAFAACFSEVPMRAMGCHDVQCDTMPCRVMPPMDGVDWSAVTCRRLLHVIYTSLYLGEHLVKPS